MPRISLKINYSICSFLIINSIVYSQYFNIKIGFLSASTQIINTVLLLGFFCLLGLEFDSKIISSILLMLTYSLENFYPYLKKNKY